MVQLVLYVLFMVAVYFLLTLFVPINAVGYALGAMGMKIIFYAIEVEYLQYKMRLLQVFRPR
jgi:predicted RND superfamily exporter protein